MSNSTVSRCSASTGTVTSGTYMSFGGEGGTYTAGLHESPSRGVLPGSGGTYTGTFGITGSSGASGKLVLSLANGGTVVKFLLPVSIGYTLAGRFGSHKGILSGSSG